MADQLTALQIKIEADISNAIKQLDTLSVSASTAADSVESAVKKINSSFASIGSKVSSSFSNIKVAPQLDLSGIANKTLDNLKVGVDVSIAELLATKQYLESQRFTITADADTAAVNAKIKLVDDEVKRKRTLIIDATTNDAESKLKSLDVVNRVVLGVNVNKSELEAAKNELKRQKFTAKGDIDVAEINRKIKVVEGEINRLDNLSIDPLTNIVSPAAIQNTQVATSKLEQLRAALGQTTSANNALAISNGQISPSSDKAVQSLKAFEQVLRDSPSFAYSASQGLIAISNNIGPLTDRFNELKEAAKQSGKSVGAELLAAAKGPAGITIAISALVTIVTVLVAKFQQAGSAAKKLSKDSDDAKNSLSSITTALGGEASQIAGLIGLIEKETTTRLEKESALKKLASINSKYFGELKNEEGIIGTLNRAYSSYIDNLLQTAKAKVGIEKLSKEFSKLLDLQLSVDEDYTSLDINLNGVSSSRSNGAALVKAFGESVKKDFNNNLPNLEAYVGGQVSDTFNRIGRQAQAGFENGIKVFDLTGTNKKVSATLNKIDFIGKYIAKNATPEAVNLDGKGDSDKVKDYYTSILQAEKEVLQERLTNLENFNKKYIEKFSATTKQLSLDAEIEKKKSIVELDFQIKVRGIDKDSPFKKQLVELYRRVANEQLKGIEVEAADTRIKVLVQTVDTTDFDKKLAFAREQIRKKGVTGLDNVPLKFQTNIPLPKNVFEGRIDEIVNKINNVRKFLGLPIAPKDFWTSLLPPLSEFTDLAEGQKSQLEQLKEVYNSFYKLGEERGKSLQRVFEDLANIIAGSVANAFSQLFQTIANEGKLSIQQLGDALKSLVIDVISATIRMLIFEAVLNAIMAATGGGVPKPKYKLKIPGFDYTAFATGGIVSKPTFGLVGEAGTEAILPLSYLNNLLLGVSGAANLQAKVSGDDLLFVMNRATRRQGRGY